MENKGVILKNKGQYVDAKIILEEVLDIKLKNNNNKDDDISFSYIYMNLGNIYNLMKDFDKSLEYLYKSLEIIKKKYGDKHFKLCDILINIGNLYKNNS